MDLLEELILKTLKELRSKEFEDFKVHLQHPDIFEGLVSLPPFATPNVPIPHFLLERNNKKGVAYLMVLSYPNHAPQIMVNVLKKVHRNDLLHRFTPTSEGTGEW